MTEGRWSVQVSHAERPGKTAPAIFKYLVLDAINIDDTTVLIDTGGTGVNNTVAMAEISVFLVALTGERLE